VISDATVTATFTLRSTTIAGNKTVIVANSGGAISNGVAFTVVTPTAPVLSTITPSSGFAGTIANVTLTGSNLTGVTALNPGAANISVSNMAVVSDTTITATVTIGAGILAGTKNVTVARSGVSSNSVQFTVLRPVLSSISPNAAMRGTSFTVSLTGTNLDTATGVSVSGSGVAVTNVAVVNSTTVTATFTVSLDAAVTSRSVSVRLAAGAVSNSLSFTAQGPTLASISPNTHTRGGAGFTVTLTGTNLGMANGVTVFGSGVTVSNVAVVNSTTLPRPSRCPVPRFRHSETLPL